MLSLSASLYLRWERPRMKSVNINSFKHEGAYYLFDSPVTTAQSWWWLTTEAEAMWVLPNLQIQVHVCMQTLWQLKPFVAQALELLLTNASAIRKGIFGAPATAILNAVSKALCLKNQQVHYRWWEGWRCCKDKPVNDETTVCVCSHSLSLVCWLLESLTVLSQFTVKIWPFTAHKWVHIKKWW